MKMSADQFSAVSAEELNGFPFNVTLEGLGDLQQMNLNFPMAAEDDHDDSYAFLPSFPDPPQHPASLYLPVAGRAASSESGTLLGEDSGAVHRSGLQRRRLPESVDGVTATTATGTGGHRSLFPSGSLVAAASSSSNGGATRCPSSVVPPELAAWMGCMEREVTSLRRDVAYVLLILSRGGSLLSATNPSSPSAAAGGGGG
eukprot:GHVU01130585.1.p1 GENE.GHVU01130585.1~~GHVU01130585.1.p1  ORF type:complete len:201 (+),score=28.30 GHVU01130585.1:418-1020(+)